METPYIPSVVLAGRPNAGKSTLFNRLAKSRRSITDPAPGVTRDCIEKEILLGTQKIKLIDTGGFKLDRDGEIEDEVYYKTKEAVKNADLIVLILEAGEITAQDEEFILFLRKYTHKIIACVNKTEGGRKTFESYNYFSYGFDDIFFISAEHGDNVNMLSAEIEKRAALIAGLNSAGKKSSVSEAETEIIKIAIAGKPNTGKSTLSNKLLGKNYSIVSSVAGTTRDVVEGKFIYKGKTFLSLDTAGIRRKSKVSENIEYYSVNRAIKAINEADIIILMIDAEESLTEQDKKIAALASQKGCGVIIALNKWDLMPDIKNNFNAVCDKIRYFFGQMNYAPILPLSAKDGTGINTLLNTALKMYGQLTRKIETSVLNEALTRWQEQYPPPSGPKTRFSIKYGTQSSVNPVEFNFFVTRPRALKGNYAAYIENQIRETLMFSMIPVRIIWKGTRAAAARCGK